MAADDHPHPSGRRAALLGALALVVLVAQQPWNERLTGSAAPHGIVSFEVAGTAERAAAMLEQWAAAGETSTAWWLMAIDLGYPILYAVALLAGLAWALRGRPSRWRIAPVAAAVLDYVENAGLIAQLAQDHGSGGLAAVAAVAAYGKFALIIASLVMIVIARRRRRG